MNHIVLIFFPLIYFLLFCAKFKNVFPLILADGFYFLCLALPLTQSLGTGRIKTNRKTFVYLYWTSGESERIPIRGQVVSEQNYIIVFYKNCSLFPPFLWKRFHVFVDSFLLFYFSTSWAPCTDIWQLTHMDNCAAGGFGVLSCTGDFCNLGPTWTFRWGGDGRVWIGGLGQHRVFFVLGGGGQHGLDVFVG